MPIQYVGGSTGGFANGTIFSLGLTGLTGGIGTSPQPGDLVVVATSETGATDIAHGVAAAFSPGYTELAELYANGSTYDTNLSVSIKFMGTTPDTTVTVSGSGNTSNAVTAVVMVFRGVSETSFPLQSAIGTASIIANPPTITVNTPNSWVVAVGAAASSQLGAFTSSTLTNFRSIAIADNYDSVTGMGYIPNTSGTVDPAAFSGVGSSTTATSWAAVTLALSPILYGQTTGSIGFTGTAEVSAGLSTSGQAAGSFDLVGSAEGTVESSTGPIEGITAGNLDLLGTAEAVAPIAASSEEVVSLTGSSAGRLSIQGIAASTIALTGGAEAGVRVEGTSAETVALTGSAQAANITDAISTGTLPLTGASTALLPITAQANGTLGLPGTTTSVNSTDGIAIGSFEPAGSAQASVVVSGMANGELPIEALVSNAELVRVVGTLGLDGLAATRVALQATAAGTVGLVGVGELSVDAQPQTSGQATGVAALTGTAQAVVITAGRVDGNFDTDGAAAAATLVRAQASSGLFIVGQGEIKAEARASTSGQIELFGGAVSQTTLRGQLVGSLELLGSARIASNNTVFDPSLRRAVDKDSLTAVKFTAKVNSVIEQARRNSVVVAQTMN